LTTEAEMLGWASEYVHTSIQTDHEIPDLQLEYSNCICCHKIHWPSSVVTQRMRRVPNLFFLFGSVRSRNPYDLHCNTPASREGSFVSYFD
jgi:hypothetical protein